MVKQYELLESKVEDVVVREALRRIRAALQDLDQRSSGGTSGDDITNIFNALSIWVKITTNADASTSTIIDQVDVSQFSTLKYVIDVQDTVNNKTKSMEMIINNENGSLKESVFGRIGNGIDFSINTVNNSGTMELTITNNEAIGLSVSAAKLIL